MIRTDATSQVTLSITSFCANYHPALSLNARAVRGFLEFKCPAQELFSLLNTRTCTIHVQTPAFELWISNSTQWRNNNNIVIPLTRDMIYLHRNAGRIKFTCAVSSITLITTKTTTEVGSFSVVTQSVEVTLICFRACAFIDVYN